MNKLQMGKNEIQKIALTANEKKQVFLYVLNSPVVLTKPTPSPYYSFIYKLKHPHIAFAFVILILVITTGSGVVFASQGSLPNSILYPIKVNIVEPVQGAFIFSSTGKAEYESKLATKRLVEAETLADEGKLDKDTEEKINTLLKNHSVEFNKAVSKIDRVNAKEKSDEIMNNFSSNMDEHVKVLNTIKEHKKDKQDVSNTESRISRTAKENADSIRGIILNNKNDSEHKNTEQDKKIKNESNQNIDN